jgi:hypothetical protein
MGPIHVEKKTDFVTVSCSLIFSGRNRQISSKVRKILDKKTECKKKTGSMMILHDAFERRLLRSILLRPVCFSPSSAL